MKRLKTVQFIHLAFCYSILFFGAIAIVMNYETLHLNTANISSEPLLMIAPAFALLSIISARSVFHTMIKGIRANLSISTDEKISHYQTAFIVKAAILEAAILFNIVIFLLTSNIFTLFFAALCLIVLVLARPTKEKVAKELNLSDMNSLDGI